MRPAGLVEAEDLDVHLLPDVDGVGRVGEAAPRHVGDVQEAVDAAEVDERAVVREVLDDALEDAPVRERGGGFLLLDLGELVEERLAREDDVAALLVERHDAELEIAALQDVEVLERARVRDRAGQERPHADVDGESALHAVDHAALDGFVRGEGRLDDVPRAPAARLLVRQHDVAVRALRALEDRFDLLARVRQLVGGNVVELGARDDPFALVADVHEDLVVRHLKHAALDELALLQRAFALGEEAGELPGIAFLCLGASLPQVRGRHVVVLLNLFEIFRPA